jgi:hypothetical protein
MSPRERERLSVLPGMTLEQSRAVRDLREAGFAVCIFTPDELGETPADTVEETMCMRGWDTIQN